ncbi:MAG: Phosphate acyltransferase [Anaerolineae bacterium]|nr:Phosphate acyltransferase [Anaerolineae bacterium]
MKIALDVMGGDHAPAAIVHGAVWAARDFGVAIQLVGQPDIVTAELAKHDTRGLHLTIVPASQVIEMDESPVAAVKAKPDSSMSVALQLVKKGESDAFVTAGNSGGALAAALFGLGRIKGIKRPALGTIFPTDSKYGFCFLLDVGANSDVRHEHLHQFALMGHHYARHVLDIPAPRVGLLSIGEEEEKGNLLTQRVSPLLRDSNVINFVGNVEGKDIPTGMADVIVTDGFTGNVYIKGAEGVAWIIQKFLEREIKARPTALLGALLARGAIKAFRTRLDYREFGGGPLLGVNGVVIVAHGRSDPYALRHAIRVAKQAAEHNLVSVIANGLDESISANGK